MKNSFLLFSVSFILLMIHSCTQPGDNKSINVDGQIQNPKGDTVIFYHQDTSFITTIDEAGIFAISFPMDSSDYVYFSHGGESTAMYLKPGKNVKLGIDTEEFDETIQYENSEESSFLAGKYLIEEDYDFYGTIFTIEEEEYLEDLADYENRVLTDMTSLSDEDFINKEKIKLGKSVEFYKDNIAKAKLVPNVGEPWKDFSFPNKDGEEVSLSDYLGSYVYVDVWATWCGPCVEEIPAMIALQQDYQDKNIVFMSVSVDVDAKKEEWLNMLTEKNMQGIQLFSSRGGTLRDDYFIRFIPRFFLFDDEGNVLDINAPKPSSEDIRGIFDNLL